MSKTEYFPAYIRTCPDEDMEDNNDAMKKVVTSIKKEAANLKIKNDCDFGQINYQSSTEATATTLLHFISNSISNGEITKQCIQYNITKYTSVH